MQTFEIKNEYFLDKLNKIENRLNEIDYPKLEIDGEHKIKERDYYLSREYLNEVRSQGKNFTGFPDAQPRYVILDKEIQKHKSDITEYFFIRRECLDATYPAGGFCSWHNNANVPGWGIMMSWSETGEGDFRYLNEKDEVIVVQDKKGWSNFKHFYFGNYLEPEKLVYHASSNDCLRYTMAFNFGQDKKIYEETLGILVNEK